MLSMGNLGVRVRYEALNDDQFKVEALLPIEENEAGWQNIGTVSQVEDDDQSIVWEFEEKNGRTTIGKDRRTAICKVMILMGYARRYGDVLEDLPQEERENGRRRHTR